MSTNAVIKRLFSYEFKGKCRGGDSNSYSLAATAPSTLRVYQFHHLGSGI